jgi:hypothetical protein
MTNKLLSSLFDYREMQEPSYCLRTDLALVRYCVLGITQHPVDATSFVHPPVGSLCRHCTRHHPLEHLVGNPFPM